MRAMKLNPESWDYKRRVERMKKVRKLCTIYNCNYLKKDEVYTWHF